MGEASGEKPKRMRRVLHVLGAVVVVLGLTFVVLGWDDFFIALELRNTNPQALGVLFGPVLAMLGVVAIRPRGEHIAFVDPDMAEAWKRQDAGPIDAEDGYCRQCRYSLRGLPESRCPECGTEFDPANPTTFLTTIKRQVPLKEILLVVFAFWTIRFGEVGWQMSCRRRYYPDTREIVFWSALLAFTLVPSCRALLNKQLAARLLASLALLIVVPQVVWIGREAVLTMHDILYIWGLRP